MQQQEFEKSISKFFEKAGVRLIKKGEGYDDKITFPAYLLLDTKRKSYYFAETDIQTINNDTAQSVSKLAADNSLSENNANALYKIGQDISANNNKFELADDDISAFECKSALIISEENSAEIKEYLNSNSYKFQTVPLKGEFLVIFFDKGMEDNLAELYKKYSNDTNNILEEDDIAPVFAPKEDSSIEDIDLSAPKNSNFDAETPLVEPKPENDIETKSAKVESNSTENAEESSEYTAEDELLDSIDLSDLLKPAQEDDTPKDEVEAELLYGKLLNEQTDKIEVSTSGPVEKTFDEIPAGIISEEEIKDMASDESGKSNNTSSNDKKNAKLKNKEEKRQAKLAKKRAKEAEKYTYENRNKPWLDIPGKIAANIIGIIFFLPAYILNKIVGRFLPPFVIYWLTAIIAIYGGYQFVFSLLPQPLSDVFLKEANNAVNMIQNYKIDMPDGQAVSDIAEMSIAMMKSSAIAFYASLKGVEILMNNGYLLQYSLGFGAVIMIFPAFRFIGKTITIFSVISYFMLPVVTYSQSMLIQHSFNMPDISLTASAVHFIVYIYPLLLLFAVLYISSALVPDKNTRKEVLP